MFKQTIWTVYRRTRKDENYANYKEALNLATTEIRKSKRTFEKNWQVIYLPVPFTKFEGNKSEHLGQLFVTPEMIANKIKKMKDNKSPGVDGIPPKLLKEIVEQISTPLAKLFNFSLEEGIVPSEWKEANITPLFKKGSRNEPEFNISYM